MLTDNEIRGITEDTLRFKALAQTLEEIICSSEAPIVIGIYGEWGSGKTSLMRMTENLLSDKEMIKTVWFDAWKFDKIYDLRVALIHTVLRRIQEDENAAKNLRKKVEDVLKRVNWLGLGKAALSHFMPLSPTLQEKPGFLLKNQEDVLRQTLELIGDFEEEFNTLVKDYVYNKGKLVVFVDDLDRCIPKKAIDVLEAIKLFLNVRRSVFIVGADRKVIEDGIIRKYGEKSENWGKNYLDKIIQIPINIPPLKKDIITEQFIPGLNLSEEIRKYAEIIAEVGDNPRTIKRLLNRLEIQRILASKRKLVVESGVLAKLAVLEFRWHDFYTDLISVYCETSTNLIQILEEISESKEDDAEKKLEEWKTLKKYFGDKKLMNFLLEGDPLLANVDLDQYVYMVRSTTELKESAENYFSVALSLDQKGDYIKAAEVYYKAIELNPKYEEAWGNRGVVLGKLERHEEAIACFDKVIELNPKYEKAWYNKSVALNRLGRHGEAIACFDKAIELNPKYEEAWYRKGVVLNKLERYEEAIACFDKVIELNPKYEKAQDNRDFALAKLERYEEIAGTLMGRSSKKFQKSERHDTSESQKRELDFLSSWYLGRTDKEDTSE